MQITSDIELSGAGCTTAITPNQLVQSSSENDIHAQPVRELDHRPHDSLVTGIIREPPATKDWSIFNVVMGQHFRCCRQE